MSSLRKDKPAPGRAESYKRGLLLYRRGDYEQAAAELAPLSDGGDLIGRLARFYRAMADRAIGIDALGQGRYDQAERHLRMAAEAIGWQADLGCYLARLYAQTGQAEQCLLAADRAVDEQPDDAASRRRLSQAQWRAGRRAQAYMTLNAALRELGEEPCLHLQLGLFHAAEGDFARASAHLGRAAQLDPANAHAHYNLALVAAASREVISAVRGFQRVLQLCPADLLAAYQLSLAARAAREQGLKVSIRLPEPSPAPAGSQVAELARYVASEPQFVEAFLALPASETDEELFGLLASVVKRALGEHPRYADLQLACSRVLHRLRRTAQAIRHAVQAVRINSRYVEALVHLGRLYWSVGRAEAAMGYLERAIACGADWPDVHCLAGEICKSRGDSGGARGHLRRALELNAGYGRPAELLASLAA